jgi:hypothetical protein
VRNTIETKALKMGQYATLALLLCLSLVIINPVFAAEGSSSGTVHVASPAPSISSAELWDSGETTDNNNTALTVDTEYHINFTVADTNSLANLDNVTIVIWESGTSSEVDSDAESNHCTFTWIESTDTWASTPSGFVTSANCNDPGTGSVETSYEFTLAFDLSKVAKYNSTNTAWKIKIYAFDDEAGSDSDGTLMFGVAFYSEISISDTTHGWTSLDPGATDEQIDSPADSDIDFTIVANDNWTIQAKGSGDLTSGANTITLSNVKIHKDTLGSAASLTTSYVDVGGLVNQTSPTSESGTAIFCTLWLNVPTGTLPGDYTYTLYLQIVQQT